MTTFPQLIKIEGGRLGGFNRVYFRSFIVVDIGRKIFWALNDRTFGTAQ